MRTIDGLFAECKMLSDDELSVLMNGLQTEVNDRRGRVKREAWQKVVDAINMYAEEYGPIEVCDDDVCIYLHAREFSHILGEISVG